MNILNRKFSFRKVLGCLGLVSAISFSSSVFAQTTQFTWASLGLSDEDAVPSGTILTSADGSTTVTVTWTTVTDGGSFVSYAGDDFLSFERLRGGQSDVLEMGFDNGNNDPDDRVIVTLTFSRAVTGLEFDFMDIDDGSWWDGLEVFADGVNVRTVDSGSGNGSNYVSALQAYVQPDNESYMNGWESNGGGNAGNGQTLGNMTFDFGNTAVTTIRMEYFSTDDANSDPGGQVVGIGSIISIDVTADLDTDDDGILNEVENPSTTTTVSLSGSFPSHFDTNTFSELFDGDTSYSTASNKRLHQDGDLDMSLTTSVPAGTTFDVYWDNDQSGSEGIIVSFSNNGGASFFQVETNEPASNEPVTRTWSLVSNGVFNYVRLESIDDNDGDDPRIHELGINGATGSQTMVVGGMLDTDGDGITDDLDLDSDNDGISDLYESGTSAVNIAADTNSDGTISLAESAAIVGGSGDADFDGLMDIFDQNTGDTTAAASIGTNPINSDGDLILNFRDLDSDADGIPDTVEARATTPYAQNDGDVSNNDADGDGVIQLFDTNDLGTGVFGGTFVAPQNTDGTEQPDFLDQNSEGDAATDIAESGLTLTGTDSNNDGIDDNVGASYSDPDGNINTPSLNLANEFGDTTEVAYREVGVVSLGMTKTVSPNPAVSGQTVTFTLTVCETANQVAATNVIATDIVDAAFGTPTNPGGDVAFTYAAPTLSCDFGTLNPGICGSCTFDAVAP